MANRLTVQDDYFLAQETSTTPLHAGGIGIFEPGLGYADVLRILEQRLHRIPRARKRVRAAALGTGRPVWIDDPAFDLSYHLRHAALPEPGDAGQLGEFLARIISRPLDRSRPLWEMYVIEGLAGGRTCVYRKVHLAMVGEDHADPFGVLLDESAEVEGAAEVPRWEAAPPPSTAALATEAVLERAQRTAEVSAGLWEVALDPRKMAQAAGFAAGSALGLAGRLVRSAPSSPLNGKVSPHRRYAIERVDFGKLREIRRAVDCSINDVVVAVSGDAVGRLLRWRGHDTKDLDLRVMVPVRVHGRDRPVGGFAGSEVVGDGVVGVIVPLPVMEIDPLARLYRVMGELAGLRESRQAVAADNLVRLASYAPPNLHSLAARVAAGEARYNVALSNAPGAQEPRFLAGHRMLETYPFIPLAGDCRLSIALSSYDRGLYAGFLGDRVAMPDLHLLGDFFHEALDALVVAAEKAP